MTGSFPQLCNMAECKTNTIQTLMHQMRISTDEVSSVMLRPKKKKEIRKLDEPKNQSAMKLSQFRRRIEIIHRLEMNL
jgi:hypothetical protein